MTLPRSFYERPVLTVARDLIGKVLVHHSREGIASGRIVEVEAYRGPEDQAAHSANGRRTRRTEAMWGEAGHAYVYFIYGMHWAFNVVVGKVGEPHAVLVRALEPLPPLDLMRARRRVEATRALCSGPGKLCQALGIDGSCYGKDLCGTELFIDEGDAERKPGAIGRSPRINVDYSGAWAARPWRFYERGNPSVSVKPRE